MSKLGTIAVIGYGSQGSTWAANLRDGGYDLCLHLPENSSSTLRAWRAGFIAVTPPDQLWEANIYALLIPDHLHQHFLTRYQRYFQSGSTLVLAHGFSMVFDPMRLRPDLNIVLVAPKIIGKMLRQNFLNNSPTMAVLGVKQDVQGNAWEIARTVAQAVCGAATRTVTSSFEEECKADLFSEQAILCGGLPALIQATYELMIQNGIQPEIARQECFRETSWIAAMIARHGLKDFYHQVSPLARIGGQRAGRYLIDRQFRAKLSELYKEIDNGTFANSILVGDLINHEPTLEYR